MQIVFTLLLAVASLLSQVQANPNLDPVVVKQDIQFAGQAIKLASDYLQSLSTSTVQSFNPATPVTIQINPTQDDQGVQTVNIVPTITPVVAQSAPVIVPPAPTCSVGGSLIRKDKGDGVGGTITNFFVEFLVTKSNASAVETIGGLPIKDMLPISTTTDYTVTVTDSFGQTGTCDTVVVVPTPVCVNIIGGQQCSYQ